MRHLFVDSYFIFLLHQRLLNKQTNKIFDITNLSHVVVVVVAAAASCFLGVTAA